MKIHVVGNVYPNVKKTPIGYFYRPVLTFNGNMSFRITPKLIKELADEELTLCGLSFEIRSLRIQGGVLHLRIYGNLPCSPRKACRELVNQRWTFSKKNARRYIHFPKKVIEELG